MRAKHPRKKASEKAAKPLLAYEAFDGDESTVIVFARNAAGARREAEGELGGDDFEYCKRVKHFDQYSPGPVPKLALVDAGWWWECFGCGRKITCDAPDPDDIDDDGYCSEVSPEHAVEIGSAVYCSEICRADAAAGKAASEAVAAAGIATMVRFLLAGTPIARVVRTHGLADHGKDGIRLSQVIVDFSLPGFREAGSVRYDKHHSWRMQSHKPISQRHAVILLNREAMPAFEAYHTQRQIEEGWHRWDDDGGALHPQSEREWAAA